MVQEKGEACYILITHHPSLEGVRMWGEDGCENFSLSTHNLTIYHSVS
jgi:hypothetical protein